MSARNRLNSNIGIVSIGMLFLGIVVWSVSPMGRGLIEGFIDWTADLGALAYIIFFAAYVVMVPMLLPTSLLTLSAGLIFGFWEALFLSLIAGTLGATISFFVARYQARGLVKRKLKRYPTFSTMNAVVKDGGFKIIALFRLCPLCPFVIVNYGLGVTQVRLKDFLLGTLLGMFPGTAVYVFLGMTGKAGVNALNSPGSVPPEQLGLYGVGLLATVGITAYITYLAKNILNKQSTATPERIAEDLAVEQI